MSPTKHHKRSVIGPGANSSTTALLTGKDSITNPQPSFPQRIAAWWIHLCAPANRFDKYPASHTEPLVHRYTMYFKSTPDLLKQEWVERNILAGPSYQRAENTFRDADIMLCASNDELGASVAGGRARSWSFASGEQFRKGGKDRKRTTETEDEEIAAMTASLGTLNSDFVMVGPLPNDETKQFGKRPSRVTILRTLSHDSTGAIHRQNRASRRFEALQTPSRVSSTDILSSKFEPTIMNHTLMLNRPTHDLDDELMEAIDDSLPHGIQSTYWRRPYPNSSSLSISFEAQEKDSSFGSLTGKREWGEDSANCEDSELLQSVKDYESASDSSGMDSYLRMGSFLSNLSCAMGAPVDLKESFQISTSISTNIDNNVPEPTNIGERLEDSLLFTMDEYLDEDPSMVNSLTMEDLTISGLEEAPASGLSNKASLFTWMLKSKGTNQKATKAWDRIASQSLEYKIACPVHFPPCSLESSRSSNWSNSFLTSSPEAEWRYETNSIPPDHITYDSRRDIPLPNSQPRLQLRGGAGKPDILDLLFGIRKPVGNLEAGKKLLDQPVGSMWYIVGGRNMKTTYREAMKMTQERVDKGNEIEREKLEKKEQNAKEKEKKKAEESNPKPGIDKMEYLKKNSKGKGKAPETKPEDDCPADNGEESSGTNSEATP